MAEGEQNQTQTSDDDLRGQGVQDPLRRKFLGFLKNAAILGGVALGGGAFYEAVQPKDFSGAGAPSTSRKELKLGDSVKAVDIAQGVNGGFVNPAKEVITTKDRYKEVVDQILQKYPNLTKDPNSPLSKLNFDPNSQVALLYALGQKDIAYGYYTATIKGAKVGTGNVEVDLSYTVPFTDLKGNIVQPPNLPTDAEDPNIAGRKPSSPFDFKVISRLIDARGKAVPVVFKDPEVVPATAPFA